MSGRYNIWVRIWWSTFRVDMHPLLWRKSTIYEKMEFVVGGRGESWMDLKGPVTALVGGGGEEQREGERNEAAVRRRPLSL